MNDLFESKDTVKEDAVADLFAPAAPSLTLEPFDAKTELAPSNESPAAQEESVEERAEAMLSEEEKKQVEEFSSV